MTEYLRYVRRNGKFTWICSMTGSECNIVPKVTPKKLADMGWDGCDCACDRPIDRAYEGRIEMNSHRDAPDEW